LSLFAGSNGPLVGDQKPVSRFESFDARVTGDNSLKGTPVMTMETLANKIQRVRDRLSEIETERASLAPDDFSRKADLMDEERTLEARLGELKDEAAREGVGIAEETVGRATDYERVPDVGDESADSESGEGQ
jgi:hypothetical protein